MGIPKPSSPASAVANTFKISTESFWTSSRIRSMHLMFDKLVSILIMLVSASIAIVGCFLPVTYFGIRGFAAFLMGFAAFVFGAAGSIFGGVQLSIAQGKTK